MRAFIKTSPSRLGLPYGVAFNPPRPLIAPSDYPYVRKCIADWTGYRVRKLPSDDKYRFPDKRPVTTVRTPDTVAELDKLIANRQVTIADFREILRRTRARVEALPYEDRRELGAEGRVGGKCLKWLWENDSKSWKSTIGDSFVIDLCWFLHAEDLQTFIDEWIAIEIREGVETKAAGSPTMLRGTSHIIARLLLGQTAAKRSWSKESTWDSALEYVQSKAKDLEAHGLGLEMLKLSTDHISHGRRGSRRFYDLASKPEPTRDLMIKRLLLHPEAPNAYPTRQSSVSIDSPSILTSGA